MFEVGEQIAKLPASRRARTKTPTSADNLVDQLRVRAAVTQGLSAQPPIAPQPLYLVASRLGDDAKTVLSVYAHSLPRSDRAVARSLASEVDLSLTA